MKILKILGVEKRLFFRKPQLYKILLGKHETKIGEGIEFEFEVSEIIKHENFKQSTYENDIAILKTTERVDYNEYIRPICLPDPSQDLIKSRWALQFFIFSVKKYFSRSASSSCFVVGWGQTNYQENFQDYSYIQTEGPVVLQVR